MLNQIKTTILLASLTGIILAIGYYLGGQRGMVYALVLSAIMNFASYWFSDKLVLAMYGGREIAKEANPQLHQLVESLCHKAHLPKPRIYLVNLPVPNAFATGRNSYHAALAVTPALLSLLDEKELQGVLAHELAHVKNKDILISSVAATLAGAISYLVQMISWGLLMGGSRDDRERRGGGLAAILLIVVTPLVALLIQLAISRSREFLADSTGARLARDAQGLASALHKLETHAHRHPLLAQPKDQAASHLFIVNPFRPSFFMKLLSSHPSTAERIKRLEALVF